MAVLYRASRPLLFALDPERAHGLGLGAARCGGAFLAKLLGGRRVRDERTVAGIRFGNAIGLAAGFDKNGVALPFWRAAGFGFFEFGTVTPRPQPGNDRPRMWRFPALRAVGNRLGFPNEGARAVAERLARVRRETDVIGINLGKNKETPLERAAEDYVEALRATRAVADYFVVNVSSPNTPRLRELQSRERLQALLQQVAEEAGETPLFVKLSPDLSETDVFDAAGAIRASGCKGVVATNTTVSRPPGVPEFEGGLSGPPLAPLARASLKRLRELLGPGFPILSVGGIDSPEEAQARLAAGADLLQVYTALVYEGPGLVARLARAAAQ